MVGVFWHPNHKHRSRQPAGESKIWSHATFNDQTLGAVAAIRLDGTGDENRATCNSGTTAVACCNSHNICLRQPQCQRIMQTSPFAPFHRLFRSEKAIMIEGHRSGEGASKMEENPQKDCGREHDELESVHYERGAASSCGFLPNRSSIVVVSRSRFDWKILTSR